MPERNGWHASLAICENRAERRRNLRIEGPLPARVRGVDHSGRRFDLIVTLDNLSAGGLHVCLKRQVGSVEKLFCLVLIPVHPGVDGIGMSVAARGAVRRIEMQANGSYGLGVEFQQRRHICRS